MQALCRMKPHPSHLEMQCVHSQTPLPVGKELSCVRADVQVACMQQEAVLVLHLSIQPTAPYQPGILPELGTTYMRLASLLGNQAGGYAQAEESWMVTRRKGEGVGSGASSARAWCRWTRSAAVDCPSSRYWRTSCCTTSTVLHSSTCTAAIPHSQADCRHVLQLLPPVTTTHIVL
jgi:hypothetical protein